MTNICIAYTSAKGASKILITIIVFQTITLKVVTNIQNDPENSLRYSNYEHFPISPDYP